MGDRPKNPQRRRTIPLSRQGHVTRRAKLRILECLQFHHRFVADELRCRSIEFDLGFDEVDCVCVGAGEYMGQRTGDRGQETKAGERVSTSKLFVRNDVVRSSMMIG